MLTACIFPRPCGARKNTTQLAKYPRVLYVKPSNKIYLLYGKPSRRQTLCSAWFFLGQDFAVRTISMEPVQSVYFCFGAKMANSKFATKTAKKKVWILSFFTLKLPEEAEKIEIFPKFQRWMEKTNIFKCKPPEVHFTIRNRVAYNKQLTNIACSSRTVEYWPAVVFVLSQPRANIPQYGPSARLVRG